MSFRRFEPEEFFVSEKHPDIDSLCRAAARGDLGAVKACVGESGALLNERDRYGDTAVGYAARRGRREVVAWLLERGADPTITRTGHDEGWSPLFWACCDAADVEIVKMLLEAGCDASAEANNHGTARDTPLHRAAKYGNDVLVDILIEHGADPGAVCGDGDERHNGYTAMMVAARHRQRAFVDALIANDVTVDVFTAAAIGSLDRLAQFDDKEVHSRDGNGATAIHWAVYGNQPSAIAFLIEAGVDPEVEDQQGHSPAIEALTSGDDHLLNQLPSDDVRVMALQGKTAAVLSARNDYPVDRKDASGRTLLHWAARGGHADTVARLLGVGANIDEGDAAGKTALFVAAYEGRHVEAVNVLLERGADVTHREARGYGILSFDVGKEIAAILREKGAAE